MTSQAEGALRVIAASLALPLVESHLEQARRSIMALLPEERAAAENHVAALQRQRARLQSVINTSII